MSMLRRSLFLVPFIAGCYSYTPIEPSAAPVGTDVRAHISGAASDRIAPIIGSFNTRVLTGKVDENNGGAMTLEVQTGAALNSTNTITPLTARVPLDHGDLVELESRRLSAGRTAVLMGAIGAGVAIAAYLALHSGSASTGEDGGGGGPPPVNRIPLIRLHF